MPSIRLLKPFHQFQSNTYIISSAGKCAIIDPSVPFDNAYLDGELEYILLTHAHFDHILDIDSWVQGTGARVVISEYEVDALSDPVRNCYKFFNGSDSGYFGKAYGLSDGEKIILGDIEITLMNTPGHTVGSSVYLIDGAAFVGDCVFAGGSYGRTDLPTGDFRALKDSINKIVSLPEDTLLYPGHGPNTTVKQYKQDIGK